jgi:hypothetical protein
VDNKYYQIYQLKKSNELRKFRFESYSQLKAQNREINFNNYNIIYKNSYSKEIDLEELFSKFNSNIPNDFKGHSLSVSDVIAINDGSNIKAYYCDNFGFKEIPEFANSLKQYNDNLLEEAKNYINDFCIKEFGDAAEFDSLNTANVAYTVSEDCNHEIQVNINLSNLSVNKFVDRKIVEFEEYDSLEQLIECQLKCLDFDELIRIEDEQMVMGESL